MKIINIVKELMLESVNSYSVEVSWRSPSKPNGFISYFILERMDYSLPLSFYNQNNSIQQEGVSLTTSTQRAILGADGKYVSKKYRFEANKFRFVDFDSLTSCGIYSYRMQAFNQIGENLLIE
jgi:hypothetical protein